MRRFQLAHSILDRTPWQVLGGQFHNLGSFPCQIIVEFAGEGQTYVCNPSLNYAKYSQPWCTRWYVLWLARGFTPPH